MNDPARRRFLTAAKQSLLAAPLFAAMPAFAQAAGPATELRGLRPEDFGASGDGATDDGPAIQLAVDALEKAGGGVLLLANRTYRIGNSIELDPTRTSISGARAVLDCSKMPAGGAAIVIAAPGESPVYDHGPQFIEGLIIAGPGPGVDVTGIALRTSAPGQSSRIVVRNVTIKEVGTGIDFGARTYLCQCYSVQIHGSGRGVVFTSDEDAGENISFYGCSIFNSQLAVENRSGAFANFFGCSFDYCRRWFRGRGMNQFSSCWFETYRPETSDDIPFDLTSGELALIGGGIQISGIDFEKGNQNRYMFMIRDRLARVSIHNTTAWNWRTASDELAGGAGSIIIRGLAGSGNKILPTILKNDQYHNVFGADGGFEGTSIRIPCWIDGKDATRVGANELKWQDEGVTTSATLSKDFARTGRQSLKIRKGAGSGVEVSFNVATPIAPGEGFSLRLWYRVRSEQNAPLWFQVYFSQVMRCDEFGVPIFGNQLFWGEAQAERDETGGEWQRLSFRSHNLDATASAIGYAPAWATHVRLNINLTALPGDAELWIDDLGGWRM